MLWFRQIAVNSYWLGRAFIKYSSQHGSFLIVFCDDVVPFIATQRKTLYSYRLQILSALLGSC